MSSEQLVHKTLMKRQESLEIVEEEEGGYISFTSPSQEDLNLPPGRMHATRVPERLSGSSGSLQIPPGLNSILNSKRLDHLHSSGSTPRSRSKSPSLRKDRSRGTSPSLSKDRSRGTTTTHDANSSISSLDDIVDQDILYDRGGFSELDLSESQRKLHHSRDNVSNLPPVNERMSEDTLEDVHAFSDLVRSSNASRVSVGTSTNAMLDPLNECEEEDDDLDDVDDTINEDQLQTTIIVTNMENISLEQKAGTAGTSAGFSRAGESSIGVSRTGESSLHEEAPSVPTV